MLPLLPSDDKWPQHCLMDLTTTEQWVPPWEARSIGFTGRCCLHLTFGQCHHQTLKPCCKKSAASPSKGKAAGLGFRNGTGTTLVTPTC